MSLETKTEDFLMTKTNSDTAEQYALILQKFAYPRKWHTDNGKWTASCSINTEMKTLQNESMVEEKNNAVGDGW